MRSANAWYKRSVFTASRLSRCSRPCASILLRPTALLRSGLRPTLLFASTNTLFARAPDPRNVMESKEEQHRGETTRKLSHSGGRPDTSTHYPTTRRARHSVLDHTLLPAEYTSPCLTSHILAADEEASNSHLTRSLRVCALPKREAFAALTVTRFRHESHF